LPDAVSLKMKEWTLVWMICKTCQELFLVSSITVRAIVIFQSRLKAYQTLSHENLDVEISWLELLLFVSFATS